jgi:transmembrane sensor
MMADDETSQLHTQAIAWRLRLREGGTDEWEAFARWLQEDPDRSAAYDTVAIADRALAPESFPALLSGANDDDAPGPRRRLLWRILPAAGVAAAAAAAAFLIPAAPTRSQVEVVATAAGERRTVTLADGSAIDLNGGTRLILSEGRSTELVSGEATFRVRHDPNSPFEVLVGGHVVRDIGTVFNLLSEGDRLKLEVIEGAVVYDPDGASAKVGQGQALRREEGRLVLSRMDPGSMAGWRSGQLSYDSAPLAAVVSDLARTTGAAISLDPQLDELPFSGSIHIDPHKSVTVERLAEALGVAAVKQGSSWRLEPHQRAAH